MKVVHLGTVVKSVFGVMDDEDNVVQQVSVQPSNEDNDPLNIAVLKEGCFDGVAERLLETKKQLEEQVNAPDSTESDSQTDTDE